MSENILISLALIILLGIGAEWIGWRFHFPALILFLIFGFVAGPITEIINTDAILGKLLMPFVSFSVAIILFEGGLSLRINELNTVGKAVRNLITVGVLVSWAIISVSAYFILHLNFHISLLVGAILVVTGPTAIGPLLRHMQLTGKIGSIVKWEGIMIAPIGALLAVLVFESFSHSTSVTTNHSLIVIKTVLIGFIIGVIGAVIIILLVKKHWVPDFLLNTVSLMMLICVYTVSDILQPKSGLLAATIMGITLANQKFVTVKQIIKFKEDLRVLLIPSLFILLAARLKISDLLYINYQSMAFIGVLMLIARPVSVLVSTYKCGLNWKEILFLCWLSPRGIVAASVSALFALYLTETNYPQAEYLVPITFIVIIFTVIIVSFGAPPIARYLNLSQPNPQGVLIVGAHIWARSIAKILYSEGFQVLLIDTNRGNVTNAKLAGLPAYNGNVLSETIVDEIDLSGIGRVVALTFNDEVNSLTALHFSEIFGQKEVYQLSSEKDEGSQKKTQAVSKQLRGRLLFGNEINYNYINRKIYYGAIVKKTNLTKEFDLEAFKNYYGKTTIPLFLITENKKLLMFTTDKAISPKPGQILISIVDPVKDKDIVNKS